jgi:putative transposase
MARPLRIQFPGACYHVMSRGNSRQDIFITDGDRKTFLDALADSMEIYNVIILCYVLMSNHFHLILKSNQSNLSEFVKHFLVTYTVRFNRKHQRTGHVFQGRYKSLIVEEDAYLLPLSRYIHLNPVHTREQKRKGSDARERHLMEYCWSSFPGYCSLESRVSWLDYGWLLNAYFGNDDSVGRERYRSYVCSGIDGNIENPFDDVTHQAILGGESFIEEMKERVTGGFEREVPSLRRKRRSVLVEEVLEMVAAAFGVGREDLLERSRKNTLARHAAMELSALGRKFGDVFSSRQHLLLMESGEQFFQVITSEFPLEWP